MTDPPTRLRPIGHISLDADGNWHITLNPALDVTATPRDLGAVWDRKAATPANIRATLLRKLTKQLRDQAKAFLKEWPGW